jgi:hypothetical protein
MKQFFELLLFLGITLVSPISAYSAEVYKWVDDTGGVHYGDSVPAPYKKQAERVNLPEMETLNFGVQRSNAGVAMDREAPVQRVPMDEQIGETSPGLLSSGQSGGFNAGEATCEEKMQRFMESQECFAPFRLANGAVRAEAFDYCTVVPQPRCYPD